MKRTYLELVRGVRDAVRNKAQGISEFRDNGNGAIRIMAYPRCREADDWLGGLSSFVNDPSQYSDFLDMEGEPLGGDIVDYEHTFSITPGGSRVAIKVQDDIAQTVDCYAYSALKIAHCSRAQDLGAGLLSGLDLAAPSFTEAHGYGPYRGALCVEVGKLRSTHVVFHKTFNSPFCDIYVSVSGADPQSDLECAFAAVDVIKDFFENERSAFQFSIPKLPGRYSSPKLKRIGIIGGMSYESTLHYYVLINQQINERTGGLTSADLVLRSVNFEEYHKLMEEDKWGHIGEMLSHEAKKLAQDSGCDYVAVATNTMHKVAPAIKRKVEYRRDGSGNHPRFVHIGDCVAEKLKAIGAKRILLLGTKFIMTEEFMKKFFSGRHNIEVIEVRHYPKMIEAINRIIFDELCHGVVKPESKSFLEDFVQIFLLSEQVDSRPDAVVLGCTELNMILKPGDFNIPIIDSTQAHIDKLVELALS